MFRALALTRPRRGLGSKVGRLISPRVSVRCKRRYRRNYSQPGEFRPRAASARTLPPVRHSAPGVLPTPFVFLGFRVAPSWPAVSTRRAVAFTFTLGGLRLIHALGPRLRPHFVASTASGLSPAAARRAVLSAGLPTALP